MGITQPETIVERRSKILTMEGDGFNRPDIVKTLSKEFQCSPRTIQRDIQIREQWQPHLTQLTDKKQAYYSVLNRFEQIYKKASFIYLQGDNHNAQIGALRVMLNALSRIKELFNITNEETEKPDGYIVTWGEGTRKLIEFSEEKEKSLQEMLERNNKWNNWVDSNCSLTEKQLIRDMTRIWIRYECETNPTLNQGENTINESAL